MERINELIKGKELIVRKNVASFLEKILQFLGYDFRHDIYKKIVYSEKSIVTPLEEKIKNYYDAYVFLLNNYKNPITKNLLMRFFYIIFGHEFDGYTICKLVNMFFNYDDLSGIEIAIKYHIDIYKELKNYSLEERLIISLMIFNFMLLRYNIPTIKLTQKEINKYVEARDAYISGNRILIYDVILRLMNNNDKYQDITYYKNLKELSLTDIIDVFNKDKEYLKQESLKWQQLLADERNKVKLLETAAAPIEKTEVVYRQVEQEKIQELPQTFGEKIKWLFGKK